MTRIVWRNYLNSFYTMTVDLQSHLARSDTAIKAGQAGGDYQLEECSQAEHCGHIVYRTVLGCFPTTRTIEFRRRKVYCGAWCYESVSYGKCGLLCWGSCCFLNCVKTLLSCLNRAKHLRNDPMYTFNLSWGLHYWFWQNKEIHKINNFRRD